MGFFSGITSLFGSSKTLDKTLTTAADGIYNGLDKLFYTDEEKAEQVQAGRKLFMQFAEKSLNENSIRSVTRRWLAFIVVGPTMLSFFTGMILIAMNVQDGVPGKVLLDASLGMMPWVAGVLAFYFGPHMLGLMNTGKSKKE